MQLNKEKSDFLFKVIDEWKSQQLLSEEQSQFLKKSVTVRKFDWKQVTVYAFINAVVCGILPKQAHSLTKPSTKILKINMSANSTGLRPDF
jgi:predicted transcriptional regulator